MSAAPTVTVAVLNHRRPHLLGRALAGVLQLDYPAFEIVVVGDRPRLAEYALPDRVARAVRYFACDESNICRARNIAVGQAAGEIVAFCDDDAVPEPDWLERLAAPFAHAEVGAVGGTVRAADGQAPEWAGGTFDRAAGEHPLAGDAPVHLLPAAEQLARERFLALRGVNSAFRRAAVHAVGGFDEAFRYYLDETDMALRLVEAGWSAALVRGAEVQHMPGENVARGALRQPRDLFEVAASQAYFCRRHLPDGRHAPELAAFRAARLGQMDRHLRLGILRTRDRARLARRMDAGIADGLARRPVLPLPAEAPARRLAGGAAPAGRLRVAVLTGWGPVRIARLREIARQLAVAGHRVSCFSYMSGNHAPEITFADGVWLHRGGTWLRDGKSGFGRAARARAEMARVGPCRRFQVVLRPGRAGVGAALLPVPGMARPLVVELVGELAGESGGEGSVRLDGVLAGLRRALGGTRAAPVGPASAETGALPALARRGAASP